MKVHELPKPERDAISIAVFELQERCIHENQPKKMCIVCTAQWFYEETAVQRADLESQLDVAKKGERLQQSVAQSLADQCSDLRAKLEAAERQREAASELADHMGLMYDTAVQRAEATEQDGRRLREALQAAWDGLLRVTEAQDPSKVGVPLADLIRAALASAPAKEDQSGSEIGEPVIPESCPGCGCEAHVAAMGAYCTLTRGDCEAAKQRATAPGDLGGRVEQCHYPGKCAVRTSDTPRSASQESSGQILREEIKILRSYITMQFTEPPFEYGDDISVELAVKLAEANARIAELQAENARVMEAMKQALVLISGMRGLFAQELDAHLHTVLAGDLTTFEMRLKKELAEARELLREFVYASNDEVARVRYKAFSFIADSEKRP